MLSEMIIMLSGMIIMLSGINKMLCSMIIMLRGMIILLSSMISRMIINTLNMIKAYQASPKLCEMEAKRRSL